MLYDLYQDHSGTWYAGETTASSALCGTDVAHDQPITFEIQDAISFLQEQDNISRKCLEILLARAEA